MVYTKTMITNNKANKSWNVGDIVNVGFVRDLEVVSVRAEKDYMPDIYTLRSTKGAVYEFIPHNGLTKIN